MASGIQAWNAAGNLIFDTNDRISRILGSASVTTAAGSVTDARFATGTIWFTFISSSMDYTRTGHVITTSGNTISWTSGSWTGIILYGVY